MSVEYGGIEAERLWRLSREGYDRLVESGVFENERVELLRGLLVRMSPQSGDHADTVVRIREALGELLGKRVKIRDHSPLAVSEDSEPEPDLALVARRDHPDHPATAFLVVEVSQSSLRLDRTVKAGLYAQAGVPEYWVVDLQGRAVWVFDRLRAGRYSRSRKLQAGDRIALVAFPSVEVPVARILGKSRRPRG